MKKEEKIEIILNILNQLYPNPKIPLNFSNVYTLLIATLLSAHTTDSSVNKVTKKLFTLADNPKKMIRLTYNEILHVIKSCGLGPTKAKAIRALSKILIEKYNSEVPSNFKDLESLPGVGHKTASVVMQQGFHIDAFPVDTHVYRLAKRWGLSKGNNVRSVETDLKKIFPKKFWRKLHLQLIYFGRNHCTAKGHKKINCPICNKLT